MISKLKTLLRIVKHRDFRNWNKIKKTNDRILIVGNGPSVADINLEDFVKRGIQLCCVNSFAGEHDSFLSLRPKYYCAIDPDYYIDNPLNPEENKHLLQAFEKIDWDIYYICFRNQKLPINNKHIHYCYLPTSKSNDIKKCLFFLRHGMAAFSFQNVINACLYYFITAQAKDVLLIGIETDWHRELFVGEDNDVYRKKRHFYEEYNESENVTKSGIIAKGELYKYFEYYANTLKCFYYASIYARELGISITNFTMNSYVDCYDKKKYEDYFREIEK